MLKKFATLQNAESKDYNPLSPLIMDQLPLRPWQRALLNIVCPNWRVDIEVILLERQVDILGSITEILLLALDLMHRITLYHPCVHDTRWSGGSLTGQTEAIGLHHQAAKSRQVSPPFKKQSHS